MLERKIKKSGRNSRLVVDKELVRELAELLEETGLSEIEITDHGRTVRVARGQKTNAAAAPEVSEAPPQSVAEAPPPAEEDLSQHPGAITSPMVGTVYVAPEPGAPPFVRLGDDVKAGDTLFIVEAMKTMNPITAPQDGRIARILFTDGSPVEYGEVLMILE